MNPFEKRAAPRHLPVVRFMSDYGEQRSEEALRELREETHQRVERLREDIRALREFVENSRAGIYRLRRLPRCQTVGQS